MKDLISKSPCGWAEGKRKTGNLVPMTRVMRIPANKYSPTYMGIAKQVEVNNNEGIVIKIKEGGTPNEERKEGIEEARNEGAQGEEVKETSNIEIEKSEVIQ